MPVRIVLADDHGILLDGVKKLLEADFEVSATASDGSRLVAETRRLRPDVVVLDIGMPEMNGIEAARQIRAFAPKTKLVFLTQQSERSYIQEAFRSGAHGYVLKQAAASELTAAVREAMRGRYFLSSSIADGQISSLFDPNVNPAELFGSRLTERRREVLRLVAEGKAAKEIAGLLGISMRTVEYHKSAIMDELGVRTTAEMTRYAIEHGYLK